MLRRSMTLLLCACLLLAALPAAAASGATGAVTGAVTVSLMLPENADETLLRENGTTNSPLRFDLRYRRDTITAPAYANGNLLVTDSGYRVYSTAAYQAPGLIAIDVQVGNMAYRKSFNEIRLHGETMEDCYYVNRADTTATWFETGRGDMIGRPQQKPDIDTEAVNWSNSVPVLARESGVISLLDVREETVVVHSGSYDLTGQESVRVDFGTKGYVVLKRTEWKKDRETVVQGEAPREEAPQQAVTTRKATLYATASSKGKKLKTLPKGAACTVQGTKGSYTKVEYDGASGYVLTKYLKKV